MSQRHPPPSDEKPGPLIFFGSMETTPTGRKVHDAAWRELPRPIRVAVLETPAGFELNSADVAGRYATFMTTRLPAYAPTVQVIPARKKGSAFSPDDPDICAPMLQANYFYLGAGSPTYTTRQLRDSLAWEYLRARHRLGAGVCFESAASLAVSSYTMPIYEIFKVGEDLHWKPGLNLLADFGLSVVVVPHWDNTDGGVNLDTSRCYVGQARFEPMVAMLPPGQTILGIDDHTALVLHPARRECRVMGIGGVTIIRDGMTTEYEAGATFSVDQLGDFQLPPALEAGIRPDVWQAALDAQSSQRATGPVGPPEHVIALLGEREAARNARRWDQSDELRSRIAALGWHVEDTREGPRVRPVATGNAPSP